MENMDEKWVTIPGYTEYAVSDQGRRMNLKLNKLQEGRHHGNQLRVSIRSQDGFYHEYNISRLMLMVDFSEERDVKIRKIRNVDTGELYENAEHARRELNASSRSDIYKVLRGERPRVSGVQLEYFYD